MFTRAVASTVRRTAVTCEESILQKGDAGEKNRKLGQLAIDSGRTQRATNGTSLEPLPPLVACAFVFVRNQRGRSSSTTRRFRCVYAHPTCPSRALTCHAPAISNLRAPTRHCPVPRTQCATHPMAAPALTLAHLLVPPVRARPPSLQPAKPYLACIPTTSPTHHVGRPS
jgi:hypothetical protein